jgi:hypothetical protein
MAAIFGGSACQGDVHLFLGEVLGLKEGNALLKRRVGNRWVL